MRRLWLHPWQAGKPQGLQYCILFCDVARLRARVCCLGEREASRDYSVECCLRSGHLSHTARSKASGMTVLHCLCDLRSSRAKRLASHIGHGRVLGCTPLNKGERLAHGKGGGVRQSWWRVHFQQRESFRAGTCSQQRGGSMILLIVSVPSACQLCSQYVYVILEFYILPNQCFD